MSKAFVLAPGGGPTHHPWGARTTTKISGDATDGQFTLAEHEHPPGFGRPLHVHTHSCEAVYVLQGEYTFEIEGHVWVAGPGAVQFVPAGIEHRFRVGDSGGRVIIVFSPPSMTAYYEAVSNLGSLAPEEEQALAAQHDLRLI